MDQQTLLMVFIGLVALALVGIAAIGIAVGWQAYRLIFETRLLLKKVHDVSDAAIEDVKELRETLRAEGVKVRSIVDVVLSIFSRRARARRTKSTDAKSD